MDIAATKFKESSETLQPSDARDEFVKAVQADCARLREMAWSLRKICDADDRARRDLAAGNISLDDMLAVHDKFTAAERDFNALLEDLEHRVHSYNVGKTLDQRVYVSHTAEGLAIQFCKNRRVPLWGI